MGFNRVGVCALAAVAAAAGAASAQPAPPKPAVVLPAPPKDKSAAAVAAWTKANIQQGPYVYLETRDSEVVYYVLDDLGPADKRVRAWVRGENFAPGKGPFGDYRSTSMLFEVDCDAKRWRTLAIDWYPELNLKGQRASQDAPDARWTYERAPEARSEKVFGEACAEKLAPPRASPFR